MKLTAWEMTIGTRIHADVIAALESLPVPYTLEKKKDHYFALVGKHRILVGNNSSKKDSHLVKYTVANINKLARTL